MDRRSVAQELALSRPERELTTDGGRLSLGLELTSQANNNVYHCDAQASYLAAMNLTAMMQLTAMMLGAGIAEATGTTSSAPLFVHMEQAYQPKAGANMLEPTTLCLLLQEDAATHRFSLATPSSVKPAWAGPHSPSRCRVPQAMRERRRRPQCARKRTRFTR